MTVKIYFAPRKNAEIFCDLWSRFHITVKRLRHFHGHGTESTTSVEPITVLEILSNHNAETRYCHGHGIARSPHEIYEPITASAITFCPIRMLRDNTVTVTRYVSTVSFSRQYKICSPDAVRNVSHLVMDADTKTTVNIVLVKQPLHRHEHQVKIVHCRRLDNPVDTTCYELEREDFGDFGNFCI